MLRYDLMRIVFGLLGALLGAFAGGVSALACLLAIVRGNLLALFMTYTPEWYVLLPGTILGACAGCAIWQRRKHAALIPNQSKFRQFKAYPWIAGTAIACFATAALATWSLRSPPDWVLLSKFYLAQPFYSYLARNAKPSTGSSNDGDKITVRQWYWGAAVTDDEEKGYAYRTLPPRILVPSLDHIHVTDTTQVTREYRHIRGSWYLYYEVDPD